MLHNTVPKHDQSASALKLLASAKTASVEQPKNLSRLDNRASVLNDELHQKLNVGLRGMIGLQSHSGQELKLRFKDIRIKPL